MTQKLLLIILWRLVTFQFQCTHVLFSVMTLACSLYHVRRFYRLPWGCPRNIEKIEIIRRGLIRRVIWRSRSFLILSFCHCFDLIRARASWLNWIDTALGQNGLASILNSYIFVQIIKGSMIIILSSKVVPWWLSDHASKEF